MEYKSSKSLFLNKNNTIGQELNNKANSSCFSVNTKMRRRQSAFEIYSNTSHIHKPDQLNVENSVSLNESSENNSDISLYNNNPINNGNSERYRRKQSYISANTKMYEISRRKTTPIHYTVQIKPENRSLIYSFVLQKIHDTFDFVYSYQFQYNKELQHRKSIFKIISSKINSDSIDIPHSGIVFFPLSFCLPQDEQFFISKGNVFIEYKAGIASVASFLFHFVLFLSALLCFKYKFILSEPWILFMFVVTMIIVLTTSLSPLLKFFFKCHKISSEILIFIHSIASIFLLGLWLILESVLNNFEKSSDQSSIEVIWENSFIYLISFWHISILDIVVKIRTKISFLAHAINILMLCAANLVPTIKRIIYSSIMNYSKSKNDFLISVTITDIAFNSLVTIFFYLRCWYTELHDRVGFSLRMKAIESIVKLKEYKSLKENRGKGATIIENLLTLIDQVTNKIEGVLIDVNLPSLVEAIRLLRECHTILTQTDNLYSVQFQGGNNSCEEDFEEQFLQIYSQMNGNAFWNRVRFGEVTGIHYNTDEATCEISMSGQFTQGKRLSSSTLFALQQNTSKYNNVERIAPSLTMSQFQTFFIGRVWCINLLEMSVKYPNILLEVGTALLTEKIDIIKTSPTHLSNYLYKLQSCYYENPYHNQVHAAVVAHSSSCLMRMLSIYQAEDHSNINDVAVIIAALGHDAGHPGLNNYFLKNSLDNLALVYNDFSVLENVHSAITFKCLETYGANIFANISQEMFRSIRKRVIELILTTDMCQHFEYVSRFRLRCQAMGFNYLQDSDDMWLVIKMCFKCADLSHAFFDWQEHFDWSCRVVEEFYQQGEHEKSLGLPVSPLCDRLEHQNFAKSQKGFLEFVVEPLISEMVELSHGLEINEECLTRLKKNKYTWKDLDSQQSVPLIPLEYNAMKTNPIISSEILISLFLKEHKLYNREPFTKSLHLGSNLWSDSS